MKSVGVKSNILKVSDELKAGLESAGRKRELPPAHVLFREDGESAGVFLVFKGKVLMGVRNLPELDRVFSGGSLLGLPATFTGHPYSLTTVTAVRLYGCPVNVAGNPSSEPPEKTLSSSGRLRTPISTLPLNTRNTPALSPSSRKRTCAGGSSRFRPADSRPAFNSSDTFRILLFTPTLFIQDLCHSCAQHFCDWNHL